MFKDDEITVVQGEVLGTLVGEGSQGVQVGEDLTVKTVDSYITYSYLFGGNLRAELKGRIGDCWLAKLDVYDETGDCNYVHVFVHNVPAEEQAAGIIGVRKGAHGKVFAYAIAST